MALYEDSGVEFAEQRFAESRKYIEKSNRAAIKYKQKQKEKALLKQLFVGKTMQIGGNVIGELINGKADALDAQNIPALASYKTFLGNKEKMLSAYTPFMETGVTQENYENYLRDVYKKQAAIEHPNLELDSVSSLINQLAKEQAIVAFPTFERLYNEAQDVPAFENFDAEADVYLKRQNPRTWDGIIAKKIKKIFTSETPESLELKERRSRDVLYGTPIFKEITELKQAVKDYEAKGNGIQGVVDGLNQLKNEGKLRYDLIVDPELQPYKQIVAGGVNEGVVLYTVRHDPVDGIKVTRDIIEEDFIPEARTAITQGDATIAFDAAGDVALRFGTKSTIGQEYARIAENEAGSLTFGRHVAETANNLLKDPIHRNMSIGEAYQRAGQFLLEQSADRHTKGGNNPLRTEMTKFETLIQGEWDLKKDILGNLPDFVSDAQEKLGNGNPLINRMSDFIYNEIKNTSDSKMSLDEKNETIRLMNREFNYPDETYTLLEEEKEINPGVVTNPNEVKGILARASEVPVVGDMMDFAGIGDDEWTARDAVWVIPSVAASVAVLRFGGAKTLPSLMPTFLRQPAVAAFTKELLKKVTAKGGGPLLGYSRATFNKYLSTLPLWQRAIVKSISTSGKYRIRNKVLAQELLKIPKTFIMAKLATRTGRVVKWLAGSAALGTASKYGLEEDTEEEEKE